MKDGRIYVLDLAGAQHGRQELVMTWERYSTFRIREIRDVVSFGGTKDFCKARATSEGGQLEWVHGISRGFAKTVAEALMLWQMGNVPTVELLRLQPESEFHRKQSSLLDNIDELLRLHRTIEESCGSYEVKGGFKHCAFDRKFHSAALVMR